MQTAFSPDLARQAREANGLSVSEAARRAGISRQGLINIEAGESAPQSNTLAALADSYGVKVGDWFIGVGDATSTSKSSPENIKAPDPLATRR